ncbi:hypothetical protein [Photobacterium leiognathi]|uniref:hypothetical protein n=1 Tax=Photobacterium leiognathi TaxID=553611 RepID=UPI0029829F65|nr:hypothetical protein [Photobacterium leiognathi]
MLIKPEEYMHDELPIISKPYLHKQSGAFRYADCLDISRINMLSFTYLGGLFFQKPNKSLKVKLNLSVTPDGKVNNELGSITTYTVNDKSKAFRRQLIGVYNTGKKDNIRAYVYHMTQIKEWLSEHNISIEKVTFQSGIPVAHSHKSSTLSQYRLKDCFNTIICDLDGIPRGIFITIGDFSAGSDIEYIESETAKSGDSKVAKFEIDIDAVVDKYLD